MRFAIDTNVFVYAVGSGDDRNPIANRLVSRAFLADGVVPVQVLAEFNNVCRRKKVVDSGTATARTAEWRNLFTVPQTAASDVLMAIGLADRFRLGFFDALILTVARVAGAEVLLSEDMADGAIYDGIRILNPFKPTNDEAIDRLLLA